MLSPPFSAVHSGVHASQWQQSPHHSRSQQPRHHQQRMLQQSTSQLQLLLAHCCLPDPVLTQCWAARRQLFAWTRQPPASHPPLLLAHR